ncbi:hypothetical protein DQP58_16335 [Mycobacterium colombiense]|uniref:Uncharacterized protein n=1 Tax=Mycobacterium colombiense TaxID=339268 RepID=A0A329KD89_9MYCO|nr:hypothetical protein [Mycobacterium colombiense]RAU93517.1 hypothetical protein DQP58_16335 [Mycobacterium colombiense]
MDRMTECGGALVYADEFERAYDDLMVGWLIQHPEALDDPQAIRRAALVGIAAGIAELADA